MSNMTIKQFADTLNHDAAALVERMKRDQIMQGSDPARPYVEFVRRGYFSVADLAGRTLDVSLTSKGQVWLARRYPHGFALGAN